MANTPVGSLSQAHLRSVQLAEIYQSLAMLNLEAAFETEVEDTSSWEDVIERLQGGEFTPSDARKMADLFQQAVNQQQEPQGG